MANCVRFSSAKPPDCPIEFLGHVPVARVIELMKGAAMLVVPSEWYEGFPRVVVEAFATGTPLVATDIGGLRRARH